MYCIKSSQVMSGLYLSKETAFGQLSEEMFDLCAAMPQVMINQKYKDLAIELGIPENLISSEAKADAAEAVNVYKEALKIQEEDKTLQEHFEELINQRKQEEKEKEEVFASLELAYEIYEEISTIFDEREARRKVVKDDFEAAAKAAAEERAQKRAALRARHLRK